jgi:mannose-6-phosphate isomerase-like protein (cupin superfamily)
MTGSDETSATGAVVEQDDAPRREMQLDRGYAIQMVDGRLGSRQLDMHVNVLRAGGVVGPYHVHTNAENAYFILEGRVRVNIDGVEHDLEPGMAAFFPPNVPHSALNIGEGEARLLEIYTPPGADFVEVDEPGTPDAS